MFSKSAKAIWPSLRMLTATFKGFAGLQGDLQCFLVIKCLLLFRALVAEALEISFFMTRIQNEDNSEMEEADMKQWTR